MKKLKENKELMIFIAIAYGVTFLTGLLMWFGNLKKLDLAAFPNAQMFYPAAGVMMGALFTRKGDGLIPKAFYVFFTIMTAVLAAIAAVSVISPQTIVLVGMPMSLWSIIQQYIMIAASVICWIILLATKKEKRKAYGLCWNRGAASWFCIFLFVVLYIVRTVVSVSLGGQLAEWGSIIWNSTTLIQIAVMPINFFFVFTAFFGEEYGWRYYLQPLMQKKFGLRGGVLLLGVVWGLWHLPVDLFYYTQNSQLQMVLAQQVTCISLGIFFAYAYMKTNNIWVPVILHFLNNNLVPVISGNYSASVLENQTMTWAALAFSLVLNGLIFGGFMFTKPFRKKDENGSGVDS